MKPDSKPVRPVLKCSEICQMDAVLNNPQRLSIIIV